MYAYAKTCRHLLLGAFLFRLLARHVVMPSGHSVHAEDAHRPQFPRGHALSALAAAWARVAAAAWARVLSSPRVLSSTSWKKTSLAGNAFPA